MLTISFNRQPQDVWRALPRGYWPLLLLVATGCETRTALDSPANGPPDPGMAGAAGTTGSGSVYGMACTTNDDCPSGSTCCNGSSESCDGTRLPSGDGTDPGEFVLSSDGSSVTDTITGLVWQWDGLGPRAACTTDSTHLTCTQAEAETYCGGLSLGGFSDWRPPGEHELQTIVDLASPQDNLAIDPTAFSNTTPGGYGYWTSSPDALLPGRAWEIDFDYGYSYPNVIGLRGSVRCVRGARCYPTSRFTTSGDLVTDTLTNLAWQEHASKAAMTWSDAQSYCSSAGSGFRLPTLKELGSLTNLTVTSSPAIDRTAFPNSPVDWYWTSSLSSSLSGSPCWTISFYDGSSANATATDTSRVRCVR